MRAVVGDLGLDRAPPPPPASTSIPSRSRSAARSCGAGGSKCSSVPSASSSTARVRSGTLMTARHRHGVLGGERASGSGAVVAIGAGVPARATLVDRALRSARAERLAGRSCAATCRARPTRGCASCAGCIYAVILLIGIAIALSQFAGVNRARGQPARLRRDRRRDHRLRRAPDAGQLRRRDHARDHAADPRRRLGRRSRATTASSRTCASTTRSCARRRAAGRDPEREARRRASCATTRSASTSSALDVAVWIPPGGRRRARGRARCARRPARTVTVAEAVPWGVRLAVGGEPVPPPERGPREAGTARALPRAPARGRAAGGFRRLRSRS